MTPNHIALRNVGPITAADVTFGDLTVFVGPQATGKSVFLELLKLVVDVGSVQSVLRRFQIEWKEPVGFFELYFGEGMGSIWSATSDLRIDGEPRNLADLARSGRRSKEERLFYIPAQRVMSLRDGLTRPFTDYRSGDPFVLRDFSETLHHLVQSEFGGTPALFPKANRLNASLREPLATHVFGGFQLKVDAERFQKRIVLSAGPGSTSLPYLVWSAGQREFVPLLMGLYWLIPPSRVTLRAKLEWVVIEELEMGLHPNAISVAMSLVLELLARGYRVCLSTHSPHVLDVVWGLQFLKAHGGTVSDVLSIFELRSRKSTKKLAESALEKEFRAYYFERGGAVQDISQLDPGSGSTAESGWGGLSEFSGRVADIVARVARRAEAEAAA